LEISSTVCKLGCRAAVPSPSVVADVVDVVALPAAELVVTELDELAAAAAADDDNVFLSWETS